MNRQHKTQGYPSPTINLKHMPHVILSIFMQVVNNFQDWVR